MSATIQLKRATTDIVDKTALKPGELAVAIDTGKIHLDNDQLIVPDELVEVISFDDASIETVDVIPGEIGPLDLANTDVTLDDGSSFSEAVIDGKQTGPQGQRGNIGPVGPIGPTGSKGFTGDQGIAGLQGPKGDTGDTGLQGNMGKSPHDVVIRTQQEFDTLIASPTWLDAKSVLFVGDGEPTIDFNYDGIVTVPETVRDITGVMNPNFRLAQLRYKIKPEANAANSISNIEIQCYHDTDAVFSNFINMENCGVYRSFSWDTVGFKNCDNLTGCYINWNGGGDDFYHTIEYIGFSNCKNLVLCDVWVTDIESYNSIGYDNCVNVYGCSAHFEASKYGRTVIGFRSCQMLANCQAFCRAEGQTYNFDYPQGHTYAMAYSECSQLINCVGSSTSYPDEYASTGDMHAYVFENCQLLSNCSGYAAINFPGETIGDSSQGYNGNVGVLDQCSHINGCRLGVPPDDWVNVSTGKTIGDLLYVWNTHVDSNTVSEG